MPHTAAPKFLCESCGYDLSATDPAARCPECGRPVADSHHSRRIGSPYQRDPRFGTAAATFFRFISNPTALFRESSPREGPIFGYFAWISLCSTTAALSPLVVVGIIDAIDELSSLNDPTGTHPELLVGFTVYVLSLVVGYGVGLVFWLVLFMLSRFVIELWSAAMRLRSDADAADVVAYTCCSAFLIAALGAPASLLAALLTLSFLPIPIVVFISLAGGVFFWLRGVHVGLRELRYANPPPIAPDHARSASPPTEFAETEPPSALAKPATIPP